jgi:UDP-glucose-4-epimerase GalE
MIEELKGLNVLVTGGAGYIGSHMLLMLKEHGYHPIVFDNLERGFRDAVRDALFVEGDLRSTSALNELFTSHPIDLVMHFAALTYVDESVKYPNLYYENNVIGTLNLIKAMEDKGLNKLVFSSSCAVYGEPHMIPINEDHAKNPISPYGKNKLEVEVALQSASERGLKSISLRYFNAAGADHLARVGERHNPETHLIPLILKEALRLQRGGKAHDSTLKVFGHDFKTRDGSAIRDYIHVEDLCQAHMLAASRLQDGFAIGAEAYNLGNGEGFSVLEVVKVAREVTQQNIEYRLMPRRLGDPAELIGDASLAKKVLHWTPKYQELAIIIESAWHFMLQSEGMAYLN